MRPAAQLQATIELLDLISATKSPADRIMAKYFREHRYIGSKDKYAISEQYYGILRQQLSFEYLLQASDIGIGARTLAALLIRQQGLSIEDYFNSEKYSPKYLNLSLLTRLNNVEFESLNDAPEHIRLNVPEWLAAKLKTALGDEFANVMTAMNQRASTDVRINQLIINNQQAIDLFDKLGFDYTESILSPWGLCFSQRVALFGLKEFRQGWFEIQDQGSQLLALLTNVKAGDRVVDFCAGAGGKTLAMAAMMENKGVIHACDVHTKRLDNLAKRAKRAEVHNVRVHVLSSEKDKWVKQQQEKADVVLIDAPCTGTGTWRRSPDSRWNLQEENLANLVELQQSILQSASRLVKKGGRLIYATCSLLKEENEQQIATFLANNSCFKAIDLVLPEPVKSNLNKVQYSGHELRTFPSLSDSDGFYVCSLTKT